MKLSYAYLNEHQEWARQPMNAADSAARNQALSTARRRALNALAEIHPGEYLVLLDAECRQLGIDPPGSSPTGRPPRIGGGR